MECRIDEIKMVKPRIENERDMNAKTSTLWTYYRSEKEGKIQENMVIGSGAGYGKNVNKRLEMEGTVKR